MSGITSALFALQTHLDRFERTAARLSVEAPLGDLAGDMVELRLSQRGFEASARVLRTADEMIGTLLDTLA